MRVNVLVSMCLCLCVCVPACVYICICACFTERCTHATTDWLNRYRGILSNLGSPTIHNIRSSNAIHNTYIHTHKHTHRDIHTHKHTHRDKQTEQVHNLPIVQFLENCRRLYRHERRPRRAAFCQEWDDRDRIKLVVRRLKSPLDGPFITKRTIWYVAQHLQRTIWYVAQHLQRTIWYVAQHLQRTIWYVAQHLQRTI